jgi:hypothetical protein
VLSDARNRLEVALPLAPEDYLNDFASDASKQQFTALLDRATHIWRAPASDSRDEAYERAGRHVVEQADAMIALWDGAPSRGRGGTAEIVAFARRRHVPLVIINPSTSPPEVTAELVTPYTPVLADAAATLNRYNSVLTPAARIAQHVEQEKRYLGLGSDDGIANDASPRLAIANQLLPYFVRADVQAIAYQSQFQWLSVALFFIAAAAVSLVAIQVNLASHQVWPIAIELALLLLLVAMPLLGRRSRLHEQWISYRFLAERLRSAYFLALVGTSDRRDRSQARGLADSEELWIKRALEEVTSGLHRPPVTASELPELREYLCTHWIGAQLAYHAKASRLHRRSDDRLIAFIAFLFGISFVAALAHLFGIVGWLPEEIPWVANLLVLISLCVPAIGAAMHGLGTLRQFRRHADRYARMIALLGQLQSEMRDAESIEVVRRVAADTERVMREENADWFGVMRFFDVELIT